MSRSVCARSFRAFNLLGSPPVPIGDDQLVNREALRPGDLHERPKTIEERRLDRIGDQEIQVVRRTCSAAIRGFVPRIAQSTAWTFQAMSKNSGRSTGGPRKCLRS